MSRGSSPNRTRFTAVIVPLNPPPRTTTRAGRDASRGAGSSGISIGHTVTRHLSRVWRDYDKSRQVKRCGTLATMRRGLNRRRMVSSWVAALLLLGSVGLIDARADVGAVTVSGDVRAPSAFTVDQLRALPAQTASVTFETKAGRESHTYTGATAEAVVQAAQP